MSLLDDLKLWRVIRRRQEIQRFEQVHEELEDGVGKKGLWTKSFSEAEGQVDKAVAKYIGHRVADIKDEEEIARQIEKRSQNKINLSPASPKLVEQTPLSVEIKSTNKITVTDPRDQWITFGLVVGVNGWAIVFGLFAGGIIESPVIAGLLLALASALGGIPALFYHWRRRQFRRREYKKNEAFINRHKK